MGGEAGQARTDEVAWLSTLRCTLPSPAIRGRQGREDSTAGTAGVLRPQDPASAGSSGSLLMGLESVRKALGCD